jgi:type IV pilus assembly protein PilW
MAKNHRNVEGFSLVSIMTGLFIGSISTVIMLQCWSQFEAQKRVTARGNDAQENGLMALYIIEREARMAGLGLVDRGNFICTTLNSYSGGITTSNAAFLPVRIGDGDGVSPDSISFIHGSATTGNIPLKLRADAATSAADLTVDNANGLSANDLILIAQPGSNQPCTRLQVSAAPATAGGLTTLPHAPNTYNPPNNVNVFPSGGYYAETGKVFTVGSLTNNQYSVNNGVLSLSAAGGTSTEIASDIVNLQAQYGIANAGSQNINCWTDAANLSAATSGCGAGVNWSSLNASSLARIKAIRIAIVARNPQRNASAVTSTLSWFDNDVTATLSSSEQKYRYKTYETIIPLRNLIWAF